MTQDELAALDRAATQGVWSIAAYYTQSGTPDELCGGFIEADDTPTGVIDENPAPVDDVLSHDLAFIVALVNAYRAGRIAVIDDEAVPGARATTAEAWVEVLKERLEQAAHNLEVGAQLYECPGLEEAGKLARAALETDNG